MWYVLRLWTSRSIKSLISPANKLSVMVYLFQIGILNRFDVDLIQERRREDEQRSGMSCGR